MQACESVSPKGGEEQTIVHDMNVFVERGPFEGVEKKLAVFFRKDVIEERCGGSLRTIGENQWKKILESAGCGILSSIAVDDSGTTHAGCTAYLLSESSLFVYDDLVVLKTCGTTTPLLSLPMICGLVQPPANSLRFQSGMPCTVNDAEISGDEDIFWWTANNQMWMVQNSNKGPKDDRRESDSVNGETSTCASLGDAQSSDSRATLCTSPENSPLDAGSRDAVENKRFSALSASGAPSCPEVLPAIHSVPTAATLGITSFLFTHLQYERPQLQRYPHRSFSEETSYIESALGCNAKPITLNTGDDGQGELYVYWWRSDAEVYSSAGDGCTEDREGGGNVDSSRADARFSTEILYEYNEVLMLGIREDAVECFAGTGSGSQVTKVTTSTRGTDLENGAENARVSSSTGNGRLQSCIHRLFCNGTPVSKEAYLDEFWFDPCGYSCNLLRRPDNEAIVCSQPNNSNRPVDYFTVHISPEPETSYASVELTWNGLFGKAEDKAVDNMLHEVLSTFAPKRMHFIQITSWMGDRISDGAGSNNIAYERRFVEKVRTALGTKQLVISSCLHTCCRNGVLVRHLEIVAA